jgi:hypothetical protein
MQALLVEAADGNQQVVSAVLRIRDVYLGSRIRYFSIPDPVQKDSRIPDQHQRIYGKYFNPKNCFQALGNMTPVVHPGSQIRILIFFPSRIPDPRIKKALDPQHCLYRYMFRLLIAS